MSNTFVTRFAGGSPLTVLLRLIVVSFVVGILFETFGFDPATILAEGLRGLRRLIALGLDDFHMIFRVLIMGAMVVVPVWIVLRILDMGRGR